MVVLVANQTIHLHQRVATLCSVKVSLIEWMLANSEFTLTATVLITIFFLI